MILYIRKDRDCINICFKDHNYKEEIFGDVSRSTFDAYIYFDYKCYDYMNLHRKYFKNENEAMETILIFINKFNKLQTFI